MSEWFDTYAFAASLRAKRGKCSLRKIATEIGPGVVSPSTLSRLERGAIPEIETFLRLCDWLQQPTSAFIRSDFGSHSAPDPEDTTRRIERALHADGVLSPQVVNAFVILMCAVRIPNASLA